jgi:hypothetical protein
MTWCPRCNEGWVLCARVRRLDLKIWVCLECDAAWADGAPDAGGAFEDKGLFLERHGVRDSWSELQPLEAPPTPENVRATTR